MNAPVLSFNGSDLGTLSWDTLVISWYPALPKTCGQKPTTLLATIRSSTGTASVYLKPNFGGDPDQIIVDEMKPLFGLPQMGTHRLSLDKVVTKNTKGTDWFDDQGNVLCAPIARKASYFMFHARTDSNGAFVREEMLRTLPAKDWRSQLGDEFIGGLQQVYLFRHVIRASDTSPTNVLIAQRDGHYYPLSVDEMAIKQQGDTCREITKGDRLAIFPNGTDQRSILSQMIINGTPPNSDPQQLPHRILHVLQRLGCDVSHRWVLDLIISNVNAILNGQTI
jgi:hypothetical protein